MPDEDFDNDLGDLGDDPNGDGDERKVTLSRSAIRGLERDAKVAREAQAEAAALRQELAFSKVGIDVATPLGKMFAAGYDGDMSVDAVQKAWSDLGGVKDDGGEPSEPDPTISTDEVELTRRREALANGSRGDDGNEPDPDPRAGAIQAGHDALAAGRSRDEAMATTFSELAGAAARGDARVLYSPGEPYGR